MKNDRSSSNGSGLAVDKSGKKCGTAVTFKGRKLKQYVLEEKLDIIDYAKVIHFCFFPFKKNT